ncbi:uncharacterized protein LOC111882104 [Lactuca sativa]|uniref:uncharacterized protein LOC111882104 n=1 Tax=Lactuca sativa TaxID=4236 RepID=UPI000CD9B79A|nr:uncharacterized protein LOC111882104 [Lactuca sativa]
MIEQLRIVFKVQAKQESEGQISKKKTSNDTGQGKGKATKKGNGKGKGKGKPPVTKPTSKPKPVANSDFFHCNEKGHWKHNCPKYIEEVKKNKANQGLKNVRELRDGDLELHMGNNARVVVKAI